MKETTRIKYAKGFKYQLKEQASFCVDWLFGYDIKTDFIAVYNGWITFAKGYAWDGASWPAIDTKSTYRGSLFHDGIYQLIRYELLPPELKGEADEWFVGYCEQDGMWKLRRLYFLYGVNKFASPAIHPDSKRKTYTAP